MWNQEAAVQRIFQLEKSIFFQSFGTNDKFSMQRFFACNTAAPKAHLDSCPPEVKPRPMKTIYIFNGGKMLKAYPAVLIHQNQCVLKSLADLTLIQGVLLIIFLSSPPVHESLQLPSNSPSAQEQLTVISICSKPFSLLSVCFCCCTRVSISVFTLDSLAGLGHTVNAPLHIACDQALPQSRAQPMHASW